MTLQDQLAATLVRCKAGESLDAIAKSRQERLNEAVMLVRSQLLEGAFRHHKRAHEKADAAARNIVWTLHLAGML